MRNVSGLQCRALQPGIPGHLLSDTTSLDTVHRLQLSLSDSQWWTPPRLREHQFEALGRLVEHVWRTVPYYRTRLEAAGIRPGGVIDPERWAALPILTRREVQELSTALHSDRVPRGHGQVVSNASSGSTGMPVSVLGTTYDALICKAQTLRFHLWHEYDFGRKYATIRYLPEGGAVYPVGLRSQRWGDTATYPFRTGPACLLNPEASADRQLEWLRRQEPDYLMTYPSLLRSLLIESEAAGVGAPRLLKVLCTGESLPEDLPGHCQEIWGAQVIDLYSAMEVDQIAAQCPEHGNYHVQSERLLVEVLDDDGRPCLPGETGRVVVTPLFNYAMPLLRYELGDYAEVGETCACGRGLPVLRRIRGRVRNTLVTPDGRRHWPSFGTMGFRKIAPVIQSQFVQVARDRIECRLVVARPLSPAEETALLAQVRARLPWPFDLAVAYMDTLPRDAGGKFEDFRSELAT